MGPSKQQQQQLANIVSKVTQIQEGLVEQEIEKYDTILQQTTDTTMTSDNTDDNNNHNDNSSNSNNKDPILQEWRQKRILEYQARQQELIQCRQTYGHGEYMELGNSNSNNTIDIAKEFFHICKLSPRIIIHCYRPTTELCHTFHTHLQLLAIKHMETRFLKFNVQDYNATEQDSNNNNSSRGQNQNIAMKFLIEKLQIRVMPTLILIQNQQIIHRMEGCTELNNNTQFTTNFLAHVLGHKYHMLYPTPDEIPDQILSSSSNTKKNNTRHSSYLTSNGQKGTTRYRYNNQEDDDDEEDF